MGYRISSHDCSSKTSKRPLVVELISEARHVNLCILTAGFFIRAYSPSEKKHLCPHKPRHAPLPRETLALR